jgi:hypothetical protein
MLGAEGVKCVGRILTDVANTECKIRISNRNREAFVVNAAAQRLELNAREQFEKITHPVEDSWTIDRLLRVCWNFTSKSILRRQGRRFNRRMFKSPLILLLKSPLFVTYLDIALNSRAKTFAL